MWENVRPPPKECLKWCNVTCTGCHGLIDGIDSGSKASAHRKSGVPGSFINMCPLSRIWQFDLLATPFCSGVCGMVSSMAIPFSAQYDSRVSLMYLPPWSVHRILVWEL